jgi:hypothetical protein
MANQHNRGFGSTGPQGQSGGVSGRAGDFAGAVKDKAQGLASQAADTAERVWDRTREAGREVASTVAGAAEDVWGRMTECMRSYPLATFFAGMGLGFCLAAFFTWRTSDSWNQGYRYFPTNVGP